MPDLVLPHEPSTWWQQLTVDSGSLIEARQSLESLLEALESDSGNASIHSIAAVSPEQALNVLRWLFRIGHWIPLGSMPPTQLLQRWLTVENSYFLVPVTGAATCAETVTLNTGHIFQRSKMASFVIQFASPHERVVHATQELQSYLSWLPPTQPNDGFQLSEWLRNHPRLLWTMDASRRVFGPAIRTQFGRGNLVEKRAEKVGWNACFLDVESVARIHDHWSAALDFLVVCRRLEGAMRTLGCEWASGVRRPVHSKGDPTELSWRWNGKDVRLDQIATNLIRDLQSAIKCRLQEQGQIPKRWDLLPERPIRDLSELSEWLVEIRDCLALPLNPFTVGKLGFNAEWMDHVTLARNAALHVDRALDEWGLVGRHRMMQPTDRVEAELAIVQLIAGLPKLSIPETSPQSAGTPRLAVTRKTDKKLARLKAELLKHHFNDDDVLINSDPLSIPEIQECVQNGAAARPYGWSKSEVSKLLASIFGKPGHQKYTQLLAQNNRRFFNKLQRESE